MLRGEPDIVMRQRQYQDLLREAEKERLIQVARSQRPNQWGWFRKVPGRIGLAILRIGAKMVQWGFKLQGCSLTSLEDAE
jgi:hypothetical protein